MAFVEILARDYDFSVSTTASGYLTVSGINNWSLKIDTNEADATNFDDNGWQRSLNVSAGVTVIFEGMYSYDAGTKDVGQAIIDSSVGQFGTTGLRYYKISHTGGSDTLTFRASAKRNEMGGGNDDLMPWGVELKVYGKPTATGEFLDLFPN